MIVTPRCKKAIVTGGGSGIGLAIAKNLIAHGCSVCITGRNPEKLEKAKEEINSENLSVLEFDVKDIKSIIPKLNDAACLLGGYYDCVVNSAGVFTRNNNWVMSEEIWDNVMDTNLKAAVFIMRNAAICMRDNRINGNILQIASIVGNHGVGICDPYSASKNTLVNTTRYMGKQMAHLGIIINGIAPGMTYSPMTPDRNITHDRTAIGRIIEPEEIADIAMFMLSDQAKICIGETILADGGCWHVW